MGRVALSSLTLLLLKGSKVTIRVVPWEQVSNFLQSQKKEKSNITYS
jgi:hypothetical protein